MADERLARFFLHGYGFFFAKSCLNHQGFNPTLILLIGAILPGMFMFRLEY